MKFAQEVKDKLISLIQEMATVPWLFSKKLESDFSRTRKLGFESTIRFILSMESGSLQYCEFSKHTPSVSAFS